MIVEIKKLSPIRWKEFKELRLKALITDPIAFGRSYEYEKSFSHYEWKKILMNENFIFALVNNQLVGMIGFKSSNQEKTKHIAHIIGVYVDPEFRGMKLGYKLIKEIIKIIKRNKFKKISLGVNCKQKSALKLYQKVGFKIVGKFEKELKVNNKYYDEFILEKIF
jgi:ribosomal protein S18 acetylase RimI-like enzyme